MLDLWYQVQKRECHEVPYENSKTSTGAKKYTITEELTKKSEVSVILIEADLLNEIQTVNIPQILTIEAPMTQTNGLIVTSENDPDIGPIIQLNTALENGSHLLNLEVGNTNKAAKIHTDEQDEPNATENFDSDDLKKNAEIEKFIDNLLKAINEDQAPNIAEEKERIITQYYQDDEIVDLEMDDWLIVDDWGKTPAIKM